MGPQRREDRIHVTCVVVEVWAYSNVAVSAGHDNSIGSHRIHKRVVIDRGNSDHRPMSRRRGLNSATDVRDAPTQLLM